MTEVANCYTTDVMENGYGPQTTRNRVTLFDCLHRGACLFQAMSRENGAVMTKQIKKSLSPASSYIPCFLIIVLFRGVILSLSSFYYACSEVKPTVTTPACRSYLRDKKEDMCNLCSIKTIYPGHQASKRATVQVIYLTLLTQQRCFCLKETNCSRMLKPSIESSRP